MTILMHKLDIKEKTQLDFLGQLKQELEAVYEDAELMCKNKDCVPLLERIKTRRDKARVEYNGFCNYLFVNGKAVI